MCDKLAVRGPYGNHFPFDHMKGNCLFIAGGIGLAPLRSLIDYVLDNRDNYSRVDIIYGARTYDELCFNMTYLTAGPKSGIPMYMSPLTGKRKSGRAMLALWALTLRSLIFLRIIRSPSPVGQKLLLKVSCRCWIIWVTKMKTSLPPWKET